MLVNIVYEMLLSRCSQGRVEMEARLAGTWVDDEETGQGYDSAASEGDVMSDPRVNYVAG
jgi:hypothetical protein